MKHDTKVAREDELLGEFYTNAARWSEGRVLDPTYLALHESLFSASPSYHMSEYQRGLLASLPHEILDAIEAVLCFYSYQPHARTTMIADEGALLHYRCDINRTIERGSASLERASMTGADAAIAAPGREEAIARDWAFDADKPIGDVLPIDAKAKGALMSCASVQGFVLRTQSPGASGGRSSLEPYTTCLDAKTVLGVLTSQPPAGTTFKTYQWAMYGYRYKPSVLPAQVARHRQILRSAFLVHVWTWNMDLRREHRLIAERRERLKRLDHTLRRALEDLASELGTTRPRLHHRLLPESPHESIITDARIRDLLEDLAGTDQEMRASAMHEADELRSHLDVYRGSFGEEPDDSVLRAKETLLIARATMDVANLLREIKVNSIQLRLAIWVGSNGTWKSIGGGGELESATLRKYLEEGNDEAVWVLTGKCDPPEIDTASHYFLELLAWLTRVGMSGKASATAPHVTRTPDGLVLRFDGPDSAEKQHLHAELYQMLEELLGRAKRIVIVEAEAVAWRGYEGIYQETDGRSPFVIVLKKGS